MIITKNIAYLFCISILSFALLSCVDNKPEKVTANNDALETDGYIDLHPPTSYSPMRGVLCESLSVDSNGRATGECFDRSGPSVLLTRKYISQEASEALQNDIDNGRFPQVGHFETRTGTVCDLEAKQCWLKRGPLSTKIDAPRYTRALFSEPSAE